MIQCTSWFGQLDDGAQADMEGEKGACADLTTCHSCTRHSGAGLQRTDGGGRCASESHVCAHVQTVCSAPQPQSDEYAAAQHQLAHEDFHLQAASITQDPGWHRYCADQTVTCLHSTQRVRKTSTLVDQCLICSNQVTEDSMPAIY